VSNLKYIGIFLIFALILIIHGCVTPYSGRYVRVWQKSQDGKWYTGNAAVIGVNRIVTAYHVADLSDNLQVRIRRWPHKCATFVIIDMYLSKYEPYVILECKDIKFNKNSIFEIGNGKPYKVITHRGVFKWKRYVPKRGDSGSPVINIRGKLIGVVYGFKNGRIRKPLFIPVKYAK